MVYKTFLLYSNELEGKRVNAFTSTTQKCIDGHVQCVLIAA